MTHESKLRRARAYLKQRGIGAAMKDSKFVYTDSLGIVRTKPEPKESTVILLDERRKA